MGSFAEQSTLLMEHLASHGYVVVATTHPYTSMRVVLADGRAIYLDLDKSNEVSAPFDAEAADMTAKLAQAGSAEERMNLQLERYERAERAQRCDGHLGGRLTLRAGLDRHAGSSGSQTAGDLGADGCRSDRPPWHVVWRRCSDGAVQERRSLPRSGRPACVSTRACRSSTVERRMTTLAQ